MSNTIHYTHCPVCGAAEMDLVFSVKDYTVTGESFPVMACYNCTVRFTQDIPDAGSISAYYKSENYISHTNSSRGLVNRLYQWVRKKTLKDKYEIVKKFTQLNTGRLLDVGSGTGAFAGIMQKNKWDVTGIEPDKDARDVGQKKFNIQLEDISRFYDMPALSYDAITLWHVLEHIHDLHTFMLQLRLILKEKGILFIAVPNYTSLDAAIYKEYWAAYDVPRHLYHFSPKAMQVLLKKHRFLIKDYLPMWYDSFYVSMLSSQYKQGKLNVLTASLNGLRSNFHAISNAQNCSSVIYIVEKMSENSA